MRVTKTLLAASPRRPTGPAFFTVSALGLALAEAFEAARGSVAFAGDGTPFDGGGVTVVVAPRGDGAMEAFCGILCCGGC